MEIIKIYSEYIITPLEQEIKKLRNKINKKRFLLTRKKDKINLEKMKKLLYEHYKKIVILTTDEIN